MNIFDPELQLINTKTIIINKLKVLLGELEDFKIQTVLNVEFKKIVDHKPMRKFFYLITILTANDSDIDKAFGLLNQSIVTKIKNYLSRDLIDKTI